MSVKLTEEQRAAIGARGKVIVSASAGSGKTFVMIERLVSLILGGADVRRTLAVTFTNKAAAQMRERLRGALLKRVGESGAEERARLKEQLAALPLADISTIHAFCARLVRTYFYLADVDPAFRIISPDDAEGKLLSARAMDEAFEGFYESGGEQFQRLLSVYFHKKKDAKLRGIVADLYAAVRGGADYRAELSRAGEEDGFDAVCRYLADDFRRRALDLRARAAAEETFFLGQNDRAVRVAAEVGAAAEKIASAPGLFAMRELPSPAIPAMPPATKASGEELNRIRRLSKLSAGIKSLYKELKVYAEEEEERARYLDGQSLARGLSALVLAYDGIYTRLKREAGALDYDDLEHCALAVLADEGVRGAVREKYQYVFVDEYQDVNPAQERLLSLLGGEEVFLVGDAKQSIYGFRGSRSEYFLAKEREYAAHALNENFRSAAAVLEAVNRVFSYAMTEESCGIRYRESPMRGGARYGEHAGRVCFHRIGETERERSPLGIYSVLKKSEREPDAQAYLIAELIAEEVGSEWYDADEGLVKRVGYGDIAVLVRKKSGDAEKVVSALGERNIPVTTTASVNVCDFWEARLIIDWLSFLDNTEQDIPLAGAMLSRLGGFTDGELAQIRLASERDAKERGTRPAYTFRAACAEYLSRYRDDLSRKLRAFRRRCEGYRTLMRVRTAAEMIDFLLSSGLEAEIAARRDGEARLRRVRRLAEEAKGSVGQFLRRLRTLSYRVEYAESGGDDAVKVLTMHASKGLEYPVVILASLDAPFHGPDRDEVYYTDRFSVAPKSYDLERKLVRETVLRRATAVYNEREEVKEELNLLYVAMTRAKYRLHMLFGGKEGALAPQYAKRFSDFVDFSACADYFQTEPERPVEPPARRALPFRPDEEMLRAILDVYEKPYPYAASVPLPQKSSATELMRLGREESPSRGGGGATVEEGLAYHAFMEHADFGSSAAENLARMARDNLLPPERLALLAEDRLERILALPSIRALAGGRLRREQTFLVSLPAREIPALGTDAEDEIVLQGAIDLLALDEKGYLILDYKYSSHDAARVKADYRSQLALYKKAVARVTGVDENTIRARIVNLLRLYEVEM